ncbi:MAG TPA: CHRD domain-containing protein [Candidatus Binataceae bacterium]|nr:CHRD domain-containing protein [Candidatus Binataceae bacterium]
MRPGITKVGLIAVAALFLTGVYASTGAAFLPNSFGALLTGYEEVPPTFTTGSGLVQVKIDKDQDAIHYTLSYSGLSSAVTQAHIHFGERPVNGGIIVFLCDNTGKAPSGVPACPNSGTVSGVITAIDVNPPNNPEPVTAQGIAPGEFAGLVAAIEHGDAYANVHSSTFPTGEIRGWLR